MSTINMLEHVRELIFGLKAYEKVKIDIRFEELLLILPQIQIKKLEDFELLEECIYKLKEQLRIKSSNLNRVLKDTSNKLAKYDITKIINLLEEKKFNFLKSAFAAIEPVSHDIIHEPEIHLSSNTENDEEKEVKTEEEIEIKESQNKSDIILAQDNDHTIYLNNGKIPYLLISFKKDIEYSLLKKLSIILFETYETQGTNIIIEKTRALIIPRHIGDNLLQLPRVETDINEIYEKIKNNSKEDNLKHQSTENPQKEESSQENTQDKYIEIEKEKPTIRTHKKEEDSLDALISKAQEKEESKNHSPPPNPKLDKSKPQIEKEEPIEIEKKEIEINKEIEVEKKEPNELYEHEVYRDDKIVAYFKSNSIGDITIEPVPKKPLKELNESDLSYMTIFSKVFATLLFEVKEAHGTNIFFNYNDNCITIVPRYQNDNLKLNWNPTPSQPEFLDQIKAKLIEEMQKEVSKANGNGSNEKKEVQTQKPIQTADDGEIQKRADFILKALKRIP